MRLSLNKIVITTILLLWNVTYVVAQTFSSPVVTVPPGGITCLSINVNTSPPLSGWPMGDPYIGPWPVAYINDIELNILTSHPWTLEITLISPAGTSLLLSAFNGAGGTNYTDTHFGFYATNITSGTAPFTGYFAPQATPPGLTAFYGETLNGIWQICINDTLTDSTAFPPGGPIGIGATSSASGTMSVGGAPCNPFLSIPSVPSNIYAVCQGGVDLTIDYQPPSGIALVVTDLFGNPVNDPSNMTVPGTYIVNYVDACWLAWDYWDALMFHSTNGNVDLINPSPYALGPDQVLTICQGTSTNLHTLFNASGITCQWTLNGSPITIATASAATLPGIYEIIGSTSSTCDDTAQVVLTIEPKPNLGPDQTINSCSMATYDLTQAYVTTGLTAVWKKNGTVVPNPASVSVNGIYQLIVTSPAGCKDTANLTLNISLGPALGPDQSFDFCIGTSVNLNTIFNTAGFTNVWTNSGVTVSNPSSVNTPGLYSVVTSNANGCSDAANVILNQISNPVLGANQTVNFCANDPVNLNSLFNVAGLTTVWTLNGNPVSNPAAVTISGNYSLTATNSIGCSSQASAMLTAVASPALGPDQNISFCPGTTADLTSIFTTTGLTTTWTLNGNTVPNPAVINIGGNYQLVGVNSTGCPDTAIAIVVAAVSPTIGPNQQITTCQGTSVNLNSLYNSGGNTVSWTNNNNPVSNPNAVTSAGIYVITLTNSSGCSSTSSVNLSVNPKPELGNDQDMAICPGAFTDISALFPVTGLNAFWTLNGVPVADPTNIGLAGNYQLIVIDGNGCSDTAFANVTLSNGPNLGSDQQFDLCEWMNLDLNSVFDLSGLSSTWTYDGQTLQNVSSVHDAGIYVVVVTDLQGCIDDATVQIDSVFCECEADFVFDGKCMQEPVQFMLLADSIILGAQWDFNFPGMLGSGAINPSVKFLTDEIVQVTVIANLTCGSKVVTKNIQLEDCSKTCPMYFPSAFTPNKDGKNERFGPFLDCVPQEFEMEIRNRFGQVVFVSDATGLHWDGNYQNKPSPEGLYVYSVNYKVPYQSKKQITGTLSLIR